MEFRPACTGRAGRAIARQWLPDEGRPGEGLPDEGLPDEGLPDEGLPGGATRLGGPTR